MNRTVRLSFSFPLKLSSSLAFLCILIVPHASAQWYWQNPLPQGNTLYSVTFVNQQTAWASASGGTLIKSTDGGNLWQVVTLPKRTYAQALFFLNQERGWTGGQVTGQSSALLATSDGGRTWSTQLEDSIGDFQTIVFANEQQGWTTGQGSSIWHTSNGGSSWQLQARPPLQVLYSLSFVDSLHGWAIGSRLLKTTNGGAEWNVDTALAGGRDIVFIDSVHGWACGGNQILHTANGGQTWQVQLDTFWRWIDVFALNDRRAWAVSETGQIVATTNGGQTWVFQSNPSGYVLQGISFTDTINGLAVGRLGTLLRTTDGGSTWRNMVRAVTRQSLTGIHTIDPSFVWASGLRGTILRTTNSGQSWDSLATGTGSTLSDVYFLNPLLGWTVGNSGTILRTTDGGDSWSRQPTPIVRQWRDIEFSYYPVGWIVGGDALSDGRLLKTTNGGNAWNEVQSLVLPQGASQIQFTSESHGWILAGSAITGSTQAVYRTTNDGNNWVPMLTSNSDTVFSSMSFVSNLKGWVSTIEYVLYRTDDAGATWRRFPTPFFFESLCFVDSLNGWAGAAVTGEIYRTTDGGESWTPQFSPMNGPIMDLKFSGRHNGWAVGNYGGILHTTNGGTTFVAESRPKSGRNIEWEFTLQQNFPNPFNASTSICFDVHQPMKQVLIELYDIVGQLIRVFEVPTPLIGLNTVVWDGRNSNGNEVASGIYIGRVRSRHQNAITKVVLLR